ncbi:MAG: hypothetical protein GY884_35810, partial [Proteobacteria bacterium]|nr:hypothetical protein [Pseudomonadota bacterium]
MPTPNKRRSTLVAVIAASLALGTVGVRDAHAGSWKEKKAERKAEAERIEREAAEAAALLANTTEGKDIQSIAAAWSDRRKPTPGGDTLTTPGAGGGGTPWAELEVQVDGGALRGDSIVVTADPRQITDHTVTLTVTPLHHPELAQTTSFGVDYTPTVFDSNNGTSGSSGSSGSHGGDGQDGSSGGDGHDVEVRIRAVEDAAMGTLLQVLSTDLTTGDIKRHLVDPHGGSSVIAVHGGDGGNGGN